MIADFAGGELLTDVAADLEEGGWNTLEVLVRRDGYPVGIVSLDRDAKVGTLTERLVVCTERLPPPVATPWRQEWPREWPMVRVAVPTAFTRLDDLERSVRALTRLHYPRFEIVIVDNRADPIARDHERIARVVDRPVQILHEPRKGISSARNRAAFTCPHPLIAFTDDDTLAEPDWLTQLVRPLLTSESVACSSGLVLPQEISTPEQALFEQLFEGFSRSFVPRLYPDATDDDPLFPYAPGKLGTGANMAFRVDWLRQIGGFDVSLGTGTPARGGEDLAAFIRIILRGGSVVLEPAAIVRHDFAATTRQLKAEVFNYGVGLGAMCAALMTAERQSRHDIVRLFPRALSMYVRSGNCTVRRGDDKPAPRAWRIRHAAGMVCGPALYAWSRHRSRRERRRPSH